ncbi:MAG TPA: AI-2E family transporter [Tissierellaceae bacterium]
MTAGPMDFVSKSIWALLTLFMLLIIYYLVNIGNRFVDSEKRLEVDNRNIVTVVISIIFLYIMIKIFKKHPFLQDLLSTFVVSIILAYAFNPVINYLEKKGIKRGRAVIIVYISLLAIIIILGVSVIPKSVREMKKLGTNFPYYVDELVKMVERFTSNLTSVVGELPPAFKGIEDSFLQAVKSLETIIGSSVKTFFTKIFDIASKAVSIVLTPILMYYFLVDKDEFKKMIEKAIPRKYKEDVLNLAKTIDGSLILFIRGRLIMSVYIAVATTILLLIMRVEFAFVIGFITGLFDIVPYIGPFIGYLPAVFFGALSSPTKAIWISIFFVLIQWIENNILAPVIIGDNMGLHPMVILLSIIIGGGVFGVFGMILSVPAVATIKIVFEYIYNKRKNRKINQLKGHNN